MNYANELELKSLIIRIKNSRIKYNTIKTKKSIEDNSEQNVKKNKRIEKYVRWYISLENNKNNKNVKDVRKKIEDTVIRLSEQCLIDHENYERFGNLILLIIKHFLSQGKFSGYSYYSEFVSDATNKILLYLDNFDHTKISKITNQKVSAFSYITQIIFNSVLFIINKNKKDQEYIQHEINMARSDMGLKILDYDFKQKNKETKTFKVNTIQEILDIAKENKNCNLIIEHSFEELEDLHELFIIQKNNKNITYKEL